MKSMSLRFLYPLMKIPQKVRHTVLSFDALLADTIQYGQEFFLIFIFDIWITLLFPLCSACVMCSPYKALMF